VARILGETVGVLAGEMRRPLDQSALNKELKAIAAKLADGASTGEKRLALLRRQAELGDLRDAIAQRARRSAS
jgi:hypothetical protein